MHGVGSLSGDEGFSLVELMIVVLIIGILVSIAVVSYSVSISTSKKTACRANLKVIRDQLTSYYAGHGAYPPTLQDLVPDYVESGSSLRCPESGEAYEYDPVNGNVSCPHHPDL